MKPIPDYEEHYWATEDGLIYSLYVKRFLCRTPRPSGTADGSGYLWVSLGGKGKMKQWLVHRLIAITFIENPENKKFVNHKNGDKSDCRACNLEWVTYEENQKHARDYLNINKGEKNPQASMTEKTAIAIKKAYLKGLPHKEIAKKYGCCLSNVGMIGNGHTWRHLP